MKKILFLLLFPACHLLSQTVYLPVTHRVYNFLDRMEAKKVITDYRDAVKPLSRSAIARFLIQVDTSSSQTLTEVDRDQVFFFKEEFFQELQNLQYENLIEERWHLYQYQSEPSIFNVDVIGGYTYRIRADKKNTNVTSNGISTYGYVGKQVGAFFSYRDNREAGTFLDPRHSFTPEPAVVPSRSLLPRFFEYDESNAQVNVDVGFITLTVEKMPNRWGDGQRGTLILSDKTPSYPQIKLRAKLSKDIDFTYVHGWLYSDVVDTLRSYVVSGIDYRRIYKQKYIAAHMLEITPWNGVDIALGESEIYGGRNPELLYLIPIMFFKGAEHWMGDTDNSQMFFNADLNFITNYNFYLSLFIDEFSTEDFYLSARQRNQLGFTLGTRAYDTFMKNTEILVEYTRLNPWVYNHKFADATFQSHSVDLGHWLGQNADLLFCQVLYQPLRKLEIGFQFESWRKGGKLPTSYQYQLPTPTFLYSPRTKSQSFGIVGKYEIVRDMFFDFQILQARYTNEADNGASGYARKIDAFFGLRYNFY